MVSGAFVFLRLQDLSLPNRLINESFDDGGTNSRNPKRPVFQQDLTVGGR